jgi:hypothetical protein
MPTPKVFTHGQLIERTHWSKLKTVDNFKPYTFQGYKDGKIKIKESDRLYSPKEWQAWLGDLPSTTIKPKHHENQTQPTDKKIKLYFVNVQQRLVKALKNITGQKGAP